MAWLVRNGLLPIAIASVILALVGTEARGPGRPAAVSPLSRRVVRAPAQPRSVTARDIKNQRATRGDRVTQGVAVVSRTGGSLQEVMAASREMADGIANIAEGRRGRPRTCPRSGMRSASPTV